MHHAAHPDSPEGYVPYATIVCAEWQRRMFLAPEPKRFPAMITFPTSGRYSVVVKENGDSEVIDEDKGVVIKDRSWEKRDAPEAVKDLLADGDLLEASGMNRMAFNNRILEAYRRGREGK